VRRSTLAIGLAVILLGVGSGWMARVWSMSRAMASDQRASRAGANPPWKEGSVRSARPSQGRPPNASVNVAPLQAATVRVSADSPPSLVPRELLVRDPLSGMATLAATSRFTRQIELALRSEHDGASLAAWMEQAGTALPPWVHVDVTVRSRPDRVELVEVRIVEPSPTAADDACVRRVFDHEVFEPRHQTEPGLLEFQGNFQTTVRLESVADGPG